MPLPEFQTHIRVPRWQLERAAGDFTSTACIKLLLKAAQFVAQQRHARLGNVFYGESGGEASFLFMHRSCLISLRTSTVPQGVTLTMDQEGQVSFRSGKTEQENPEAKAIFEHITVFFSSKVAQEVLSRTGYHTDLALIQECRHRFRIKVTGTRGNQKEASSTSRLRNDPVKVIKVVVAPTTNLYLLLEGFSREEEAAEIKRLRERFESLGLLLYDLKGQATRPELRPDSGQPKNLLNQPICRRPTGADAGVFGGHDRRL